MPKRWSRDSSTSAIWCAILVDAVFNAGVRRAVLCPGGRNAILCYTLASNERVECFSIQDERSAAFFALGLARTNEAIAICSTSGSAAANMLPALCEASKTHRPLVVITADRERYLRGSDTAQSIPQDRLFDGFVEAAVDLPDPASSPNDLKGMAERLIVALSRVRYGPVHINVPLPGVPEAFGRRQAGHKPAPGKRPVTLAQTIDQFALPANPRTLIVAGERCTHDPNAVEQLALAINCPVVGDIASNVRRPAIRNLVSTADLWNISGDRALESDLVIQLGAPPLSGNLQAYLQCHDCPTLIIAAKPLEFDSLGRTRIVAMSQSMDELKCQLKPSSSHWLATWLSRESQVVEKLQPTVDGLVWGECLAASRIINAPQFQLLHLGNSLAIRLGNCLGVPWSSPQTICANRGVNGIDGTVSSFLGELVSHQLSGVLLIGDQALIHDLNALSAIPDGVDGCICVMNNAGSALFDMLPMSQSEHYECVIRSAPKVILRSVADAMNVAYRRCDNGDELDDALRWSAAAPGVQLIEVVVPPHSARRDLFALRSIRSVNKGGGA